MMAIILATTFIATSCSDDEIADPINPVGDSIEFEMEAVGDAEISGTATFFRNEENTTTIKVELTGTSPEGKYPVHIHVNSVIETGEIAITLNPVDGETGTSTTTISSLDDGTPITYTDLLLFNGNIDVHLSATEPGIVVLQTDIGQNELTGESKIYELSGVVPGITGTATFEKRKSGETLATLMIAPTDTANIYRAHIHLNTVVETGDIVFTFNPINGASGKSMTNISTLDDGTELTFQELMKFDGYIDIHLSAEGLATIIAQSDIGQNELTGETKTYTLNPVLNPNISGNAVFAERLNGETLVTLSLEGTSGVNDHPAHIHLGSVETGPGEIAIALNDVVAETGKSTTNVVALGAGGSINYDGLITYDGHIDVHRSATDLNTLIAQGNIGANTTE